MTSWGIILIVVTIVLFIIPLIPSYVEFLKPTDIKPISVQQDYDNNPMHFAEGFRKFIIRNNMDDLSTLRDGKLEDGTTYQVIGSEGTPRIGPVPGTNKLILSSHSLTLPEGKSFDKEVYSAQNINTGNKNLFRALLADGELNIGNSCTVFRWSHGNTHVNAGENSNLYGRTTSYQKIILGDGCHFERMHAPKIIAIAEQNTPTEINYSQLPVLEDLPGTIIKAVHRHLLKAGLNFPASHQFDGDIVANDPAKIGANSYIMGNIKSHAYNEIDNYTRTTDPELGVEKIPASVEIGNNVRIDGSVFSTHDLYIGRNCRIKGPVIAENLLVIGPGTIIGSPDNICSVISPKIIIHAGCVVYGTLWASINGFVQGNIKNERVAA